MLHLLLNIFDAYLMTDPAIKHGDDIVFSYVGAVAESQRRRMARNREVDKGRIHNDR